MTREEILAMKPGRELDALVAEKIFGWRRIKGPKFDYDGPVESGDVLLPPTIGDDEAFRMMPPRGAIPFYYFVNRKFSTDISAAWAVVEKLNILGFKLNIYVQPTLKIIYVATVSGLQVAELSGEGNVCKYISQAALLAVMDE